MSGTAPSNVNYEIISNSVVDAQTFAFAGTGVTFYLQSGSTLKLGSTHASGAIQNSPSTFSNITVSGTRTYDNGTTIIYNGLAAQTIGNGQPSSSGIITRINNTNNVVEFGQTEGSCCREVRGSAPGNII